MAAAAFQANAFQNNAFQVAAVATTTLDTTAGGGGVPRRNYERWARHLDEIDRATRAEKKRRLDNLDRTIRRLVDGEAEQEAEERRELPPEIKADVVEVRQAIKAVKRTIEAPDPEPMRALQAQLDVLRAMLAVAERDYASARAAAEAARQELLFIEADEEIVGLLLLDSLAGLDFAQAVEALGVDLEPLLAAIALAQRQAQRHPWPQANHDVALDPREPIAPLLMKLLGERGRRLNRAPISIAPNSESLIKKMHNRYRGDA